jgi:hypothetical protein
MYSRLKANKETEYGMRERQGTHQTAFRQQALSILLTITLGLIATACQSSGEPEVQDLSVQGVITPVTTQGVAASPTAGRTVKPGPTPTGGSRNIDVTPAEVAIGSVVLTLAVQTAQAVFDPSGSSPNSSSGEGQNTPVPQKGYIVLGDSGTGVTNNFDAAQNPPADSPKEMLRHISVQVRDQASGQLIPYVIVSLDLLREGRPVLQDQPLVPMVQSGTDVSQMHYGNNVKIPGAGEYQVFVRMEPSPVLGPGSLGVAQFNVSIK